MNLARVGYEFSQEVVPKVDWLKDRIQPFMLVKMPDKTVYVNGNPKVQQGEWLEFPLGIFILATPNRQSEIGNIYRDVEAYDKLIILSEDMFNERYTIPAGTLYTDAVIDVLKSSFITKYNIEQSDKRIEKSLEYAPGTEKTTIISDLLAAINFTPLFVDEDGYFTSRTYRPPSDKPVDVEYIKDDLSIVEDGTQEEFDTYSIPNAWFVLLNDPERNELTSYKENNNPDSPLSIPNRGNRRIVDRREVNDIADQESLDQYVERIAAEASQIFGKVEFTTNLIPVHGYHNVLYLEDEHLEIQDKYAETDWEMDLSVNGSMSHEVRRVVVL